MAPVTLTAARFLGADPTLSVDDLDQRHGDRSEMAAGRRDAGIECDPKVRLAEQRGLGIGQGLRVDRVRARRRDDLARLVELTIE